MNQIADQFEIDLKQWQKYIHISSYHTKIMHCFSFERDFLTELVWIVIILITHSTKFISHTTNVVGCLTFKHRFFFASGFFFYDDNFFPTFIISNDIKLKIKKKP